MADRVWGWPRASDEGPTGGIALYLCDHVPEQRDGGDFAERGHDWIT